jgi:hypothetical protein
MIKGDVEPSGGFDLQAAWHASARSLQQASTPRSIGGDVWAMRRAAGTVRVPALASGRNRCGVVSFRDV